MTLNGVMFQAFTWQSRGTDDQPFWQLLAGRASDLKQAGFTSVWMPPACKGAGGAEDVGYGIYDLFDLGDFDQKGSAPTRWGTAEQFGECCKTLEETGLSPLFDAVLNHKIGADETETFAVVEVDPNDRNTDVGEPRDIEAWTRFTYPVRAGQHSEFEWNFQHYTGLEQADDHDDSHLYRLATKGFNPNVGEENGNSDYLLGCDVDLTNDDVRDELIRWGRWLTDHYAVAGFRFDAAKHMNSEFITSFLDDLRGRSGKELFSVCEFATADMDSLCAFIDRTEGKVTAFDFPLHHRMVSASRDAAGFDLCTLFDDTLLQCAPEQAVTFVENHDTAPSKGAGHDDAVDDWFKPIAYAAILLRQAGYPCVFAGDYDADGDGEHTGTHGRSDLGNLIDRLLEIRRDYAFGEQLDTPIDRHVCAWQRLGTEDHAGRLITLASIGDGGQATLDTGRPNERFANLLDPDADPVEADDNGRATFPYPPGGIAIYASA